MSNNIYLDAPSVGELEKKYLGKAIDSGYVSSVGPFVTEFEDRVAAYLGARAAASIQSGTAAIHMALIELGIGRGDEVIVPALTFIASANPVLYVGAKPVFADIDTKTWNISPESIERLITKKTKAVIPVHLYGNPCDMGSIMKIAKRYGLKVVEDATESLGAKYKDRHTGTFGDFGCFSFNGNKTITTGGGGMIVGGDSKKVERIKFLVNQAKDKADSSYHPEVGFNYRMTNIEAALGLAQMKRLPDFLKRKRLFNNIYRDEFKNIDFISFQDTYELAESSNWLSCIIFDRKVDVAGLQKRLARRGTPTRRIFAPLTSFPPYKKYAKERCVNSYNIYENGLCLPSSTLNTEAHIRRACKDIKYELGLAAKGRP